MEDNNEPDGSSQTIPANAPTASASPVDQPASPIQDRVSQPASHKGPNASPVVLGVVALALAALVIGQETMDLTVDWSRLGPGAIVVIGIVMVVIGAIGLVRRHDDL
jgi:hypothetical protein